MPDGFSLILIDVLRGGLAKIIDMEVEQQRSPAWHPDGQSVVFAGNLNGQFDIFSIDLDSYEITNLTNDEFFDAKQVAVAKHFACEAGQRVVHAAQHLHGGIGVDTEYPLHRMFLTVKQLELTLGGSTPQLLALGNLIAEEDAA